MDRDGEPGDLAALRELAPIERNAEVVTVLSRREHYEEDAADRPAGPSPAPSPVKRSRESSPAGCGCRSAGQ
jgi:hypothetical protein